MKARSQAAQIDTVTLTVINNALVNLCREMGTAMMRTSYSTIFNEGLDFSCVVFNRRGDLIGQAEFCPTMLGSAQYAMPRSLIRPKISSNSVSPTRNA